MTGTCHETEDGASRRLSRKRATRRGDSTKPTAAPVFHIQHPEPPPIEVPHHNPVLVSSGVDLEPVNPAKATAALSLAFTPHPGGSPQHRATPDIRLRTEEDVRRKTSLTKQISFPTAFTILQSLPLALNSRAPPISTMHMAITFRNPPSMIIRRPHLTKLMIYLILIPGSWTTKTAQSRVRRSRVINVRACSSLSGG